MSDTTSKRDKDVDSQGPASEAVDPDDDDLDDDLDNALFGDDDDVADATDADANAKAVPADAGVEADDSIAPSDPASMKLQSEEAARQKADERNRIIMELMTEEQLDRYEAFRRSAIDKLKIKRVLQTISGHNVSAPMVTVVRGMAKVFVGELVEAARLIAHEQGDSGPLQPAHYRAAYQQLSSQGKVPHRTAPKRIRL